MIITYFIIAILVEFVLCKLYWEDLQDHMDYDDDFWLNYKVGWAISFGGILFPVLILILILAVVFSNLSKLWDKYDLTAKLKGYGEEDCD